MPIDPSKTVYYRRGRFTTRLPKEYFFTPSHYWIEQTGDDTFRVGLTRFATRMLGDFVEIHFDTHPEDKIEEGQTIGWVEGFKALADIYCIASGTFVGRNPSIDSDPQQVDNDPYDRGWLFSYNGSMPGTVLTTDEYIALLDSTIDKMLAEQQQQEDKSC
ncbi:glycine cleavage system protein H [Aeoliella mucimassa]|nr:glycine cleavage system protein H [Aeoliella mucimassa]